MIKNVRVFVIVFYILIVLICILFFNPEMAEATVLLQHDFPETNWIRLDQETGFIHEPVTDYLIFYESSSDYDIELLLLPDPDNPEKILTMTRSLELLNQK